MSQETVHIYTFHKEVNYELLQTTNTSEWRRCWNGGAALIGHNSVLASTLDPEKDRDSFAVGGVRSSRTAIIKRKIMTAFRDSGRDGIAIAAFELLDAGEFREDEIEIALLGLNAPLNYATISYEDFKEPVAGNK